MTYAVIDLRAATMTYARAGHTPLIYLPGPASPATRRADADAERHGARPADRRRGEKFAELLEEERVDLYDGRRHRALHRRHHRGDERGERSVRRQRGSADIVEEHGHLESDELRERILREIEPFVGGADQHDDMTMILMKVQSTAAAARVAV